MGCWRGCYIPGREDQFIVSEAECQLPFDYIGSDRTRVTFEYPPLGTEAEPFGATDIENAPTRLPTLSPTPAPTPPTPRPTSAPTMSMNCQIAEESFEYVDGETHCQLPFEYRNKWDDEPITFEYPPRFDEAKPYGRGLRDYGGEDFDHIRWCPKAGTTDYVKARITTREDWGIIDGCQDPSELPTMMPTASPTLYPTLSHACFIYDGNLGYVKEHVNCELPFRFRRGNVIIDFDYAPMLAEAQPFGVTYNDYGNATLRWCPPRGVDYYSVYNTNLRKKWGLASCEDGVPTSAPTLARFTISSDECVHRCRVGFVFDPSRSKCIPLVEPTCAEQHYYDLESCQVKRCGSANGQNFSISVASYLDEAHGLVRLTFNSSVAAQDISNMSIVWDDVGSLQSIAPHNGSLDAGEFAFVTDPTALTPGDSFSFRLFATDKCNRSSVLEQLVQVHNRAPQIRLEANLERGANSAQGTPVNFTDGGSSLVVKSSGIFNMSELTLRISAAESFDPEGFPLASIAWNVPALLNTTLAHPLVANEVSLSFSDFGRYAAQLWVTDIHGAGASQDFVVMLLPNVAPNASIAETATHLPFGAFSKVVLDGSASFDDEDIEKYAWTFLGHRVENATPASDALLALLSARGVPGYTTGANVTIPTIVDPFAATTRVKDVEQLGYYSFRLEVLDDEDLNDSDVVEIHVDISARDANQDEIRIDEPSRQSLWLKGDPASVSWAAPLLDASQEGPSSHLQVQLQLERRETKETWSLGTFSMAAEEAVVHVPSNVPTPALYCVHLRLRYNHGKELSTALPFVTSSSNFTIRERYTILAGEWGQCEFENSCEEFAPADGVQRRSVTCIDLEDEQRAVDAKFCADLQIPSSTRACRALCDTANELESSVILGIDIWTSYLWGQCCSSMSTNRCGVCDGDSSHVLDALGACCVSGFEVVADTLAEALGVAGAIELLDRVGTCGNGLCEAGETCVEGDTSNESGDVCCSADCPLTLGDCPQGSNGLVCSGHGACLGSSPTQCVFLSCKFGTDLWCSNRCSILNVVAGQ
ncbi:Hypothetical Protein FCC1311_042792 [Hondaea fermentalgiana]|uniref:Uncharacterized protein n=1 Tax=Hondaea fermentalgiana TaxID=2315210 RepID=A0A2R5GAK2_9STRA|nr:Hypothetical Protein FCC1311_042792 [Hondaea fermentalgiana]|eukprot:GBG28056.1 Hypothetical Protein FCC1311_042792 [Hondaea fermentalgiana]